MKNNIKNITAIMISGLFFFPVFCSAQIGGNIVNESDNIVVAVFNDDISQAEVEAIEQILYIEARSERKKRNFFAHRKIRKNMHYSISNLINDKSQAESEAEEGLQYIQTIYIFRP